MVYDRTVRGSLFSVDSKEMVKAVKTSMSVTFPTSAAPMLTAQI